MNTQYTAIAILLTAMVLSGCIDDDKGRYISEVNPNAYIELQSGGQYLVNQDNAFSGTYTTDHNTITLVYAFGSFILERDGGVLTDEDGERWIRA